ncbi:MAG: hypothetical protein ACR2OD_05385 [Gaiellaceae bacterium]
MSTRFLMSVPLIVAITLATMGSARAAQPAGSGQSAAPLVIEFAALAGEQLKRGRNWASTSVDGQTRELALRVVNRSADTARGVRVSVVMRTADRFFRPTRQEQTVGALGPDGATTVRFADVVGSWLPVLVPITLTFTIQSDAPKSRRKQAYELALLPPITPRTPQAFRQRPTLASCGRFTDRRLPDDQTPQAQLDANRCLLRAFRTDHTAELRATYATAESGEVRHYIRSVGGKRAELFINNTRTTQKRRGWTHLLCDGLAPRGNRLDWRRCRPLAASGYAAPNVIWTSLPNAAQRLREFQLKPRWTAVTYTPQTNVDYGGVVVRTQAPHVGAPVSPNAPVSMTITPQITAVSSCPPAATGPDGQPLKPQPLAKPRMPNLEGLALREALTRINDLAPNLRVLERPSWAGLYEQLDPATPVTRQAPRAGTRLRIYFRCNSVRETPITLRVSQD